MEKLGHKRGAGLSPGDNQPPKKKHGKSEDLSSRFVHHVVDVSHAEQPLSCDSVWRQWGPYLAERHWGTVREDASRDGNCWDYFPFDQAGVRAYRSGEDGLLGFSDHQGELCIGLALSNGKDAFLKERLFGLGGCQGNHGEDVKELYYYLDGTPSHSYMKALYRYPQQPFPYQQLVEENAQRSAVDPEFEIVDTGCFDDGEYWDIFVEYAKVSATDIVCRYSLHNNAGIKVDIHVLPQLWFSGYTCAASTLVYVDSGHGGAASALAQWTWRCCLSTGSGESFSTPASGTKCAGYYHVTVPAGGTAIIRWQLSCDSETSQSECLSAEGIDSVIEQRIAEADDFYDKVIPSRCSTEERNIIRQAYAGLLWNKQFYCYNVKQWFQRREKLLGSGTEEHPADDVSTSHGSQLDLTEDRVSEECSRIGDWGTLKPCQRNIGWQHLRNHDVISMPDKWEFPWYAAWDLAFHMVPFCRIDSEFAKQQLLLFLSERYLHPSGKLPAYEFALSDVNPPVHAWGCWKVYTRTGRQDRHFLKQCCHKLLINYTWWFNQRRSEDLFLFSGGFLGLDNISVLDRSSGVPEGWSLDQADATGWMAFYSLHMLKIVVELAHGDKVYIDLIPTIFRNFVSISEDLNKSTEEGGLWDDADRFFYDVLHRTDKCEPIRVRSLVGIVPLFAVCVLNVSDLNVLTVDANRNVLEMFLEQGHKFVSVQGDMVLLSALSAGRSKTILSYLMNTEEFLSPFGIRSLSKYYLDHPYSLTIDEVFYSITFDPGESTTSCFGGNSNWRGPVWFPMNYLILETLMTLHCFHGDGWSNVESTGVDTGISLKAMVEDIQKRLISLFLIGSDERRPCHGDCNLYSSQEGWKDLILFHEYFHSETGRGCGASHQTGWTALVAELFEDLTV
ncbi:uncharacterized protein LOC135477024 [Liolophura sinensis]|uniref:uncharacterized protein LOC135477024 n=1 Tax=Liolophura sinensis TaxID=3198878 RepID=UPI0031596AAA